MIGFKQGSKFCVQTVSPIKRMNLNQKNVGGVLAMYLFPFKVIWNGPDVKQFQIQIQIN